MEATPRMNENARLARTAAAGAMVLLKNVGNTLPFLSAGENKLRLAIFGIGQIFTPVCSAAMKPWRKVNILDGLCASEDVRPDPLLAHKYRAWAVEHEDGAEMPLGSLSMEELAAENDAALVVIARQAEDASVQLTETEKKMLASVNAAFRRTVLVLATPGWMELTDEALSCSAIVYMGIAGQEAGSALADILTAKELPSGHLAQTWVLSQKDAQRQAEVCDGFVGYRYYDTFGLEVRYPFGFGLTYGSYAFGAIGVGLDGCDVTVSAEVTNTGETYPVSVPVQVYVSHPDSMEHQPVYLLDSFSRTKLLAPGESQTLQLRFPVTELSVFHESARAFVLEEGYYDIRVGDNCRNTYLAGSIRVPRTVVVQAVSHAPMGQEPRRSRKDAVSFTYPGEEEQRAAARKYAIRLSDRNLPRRSQKKGKPFEGCRSDGKPHTLSDVKRGWCNAFTFVAGLDDDSLRRLIDSFGFCEPSVPGALGASAKMDAYGIPALQLAGGSEGLYLTPEITDEDGKLVRRQNCTAFPSAALLACSMDPALIQSVGAAVGREMREYGIDLWLAPGAELRTEPNPSGFAQWSEDPVLTGVCARMLASGVKPYGAAVLRAAALPGQNAPSQEAFRDVYGLSFEIASGEYRACLLPSVSVAGEPLGENSPLIRALLLDWRYTGMFLADGERYVSEPTRAELERSALRIVKLLLESRKV